VTPAGVTVILGPKTRLGRAVADRLRAGGETVLLVARDAADAEVLGGGHEVVDVSTVDLSARLAGAGSVRLIVAALGPVHPGPADLAGESPRVLRDLAVVEQVLDSGLPVHVVLVSSVIALAPGEDRRYYGGWKNLLEEQVGGLVAARPGCGLSVLYPGRLVESGGKPTQRVHTTYARVAETVLALDPERPRSQVVGIDSRIWLVVRSISLCTRSLASSWGRTPPSSGGPVGGRSAASDPREVSK